MSVTPVARYLLELGAQAEGDKSGETLNPFAKPASKAKEAYAKGLADGRAAAEAEWQVRLKERTRQFEERLAAERRAWAAEQADRLAESLALGLSQMEAKIAEAIARVLKPFVTEQVRKEAIAELFASLDAVIGKEACMQARISGPEDLLEPLREKLASRAVAANFLNHADCEVRIEIGQTVFETCLKDWMTKIEEASS